MAEVRVDRSQRQKAQQVAEQELINIQLDLSTLNVICRFVISDSTYVRRGDLGQIRKFLRLIKKSATDTYDEEIRDRLLFIKIALDARLDKRLTSQDAILGYISTNFPKDVYFINKNDGIGREDINWVNQVVSETLKYAFVYKAIPDIRSLCNEFMQTSLGHRGDIVDRFEAQIDKMKNQFREVRVQDSNDTMFSLQGEIFENQITDTYNTVRSPSRRLMSGMVGFNLMTGGLENGRVYMLMGDSGIGKSFTILDLILQFKKYNTNYKTKDPTKTPCIVLLTMENSITETVTRLFAMVNNTDKPMSRYTDLNEVFRILREEGNLVVDDKTPIDIIIRYKPNHSVTTDYLYDLYDELGDNGFEPILLCQDHVKRIRSTEYEKEFRIELGNIVNEFKTFAIDKDLPVLTDTHINRGASLTIDKGNLKGTSDITRRIGKGDIGESMMMIENLDMAIVINKEMDNSKNKYMVFSAVKMRDDIKLKYFAQPYATEIKLVEDVTLIHPAYKTSLKAQGDLYDMANTPANVKNNGYNQFPDDEDEEDYYQDDYNEEEQPNIGVSGATEMDTLFEDDDFAKAKRLGKVCPIRVYKEEEISNSDLLAGITEIIS